MVTDKYDQCDLLPQRENCCGYHEFMKLNVNARYGED